MTKGPATAPSRPVPPRVARAFAVLALLLGPGTMAAWWGWAFVDSEQAVFAGLTPLVACQFGCAAATWIARRSSGSWRRPRKLLLLVPYLLAVCVTAAILLAPR